MGEFIARKRIGFGVAAAVATLAIGGCASTGHSSGEGTSPALPESSAPPNYFDLKGTVESVDSRSITLGNIIVYDSTGSNAAKWFKGGDHTFHDSYETMLGNDVTKGREENRNGGQIHMSDIHTGDIVEATGSLTDSRKPGNVMEQQPVFDLVTDKSR